MAGATCSPYPFRSDLPPKCSDSTLITISHMSAGSNRPPQAPRIYWYNQPSYKKFGVSHQKLDRIKLHSFAKTSGGRGMHVWVPIRVGPDADEVLAFAESFVARVAAAHPKELTVEHSIAARRARVPSLELSSARLAISGASQPSTPNQEKNQLIRNLLKKLSHVICERLL